MIVKNDINPNDVDLLIFDVDGTLVRFKTLQKLLKESFIIFDVYEVLDEKGYLKEYISAVSKALNSNENDFSFDKLAKSFEKNFIVCRDYKIPAKDYLRVLLDLEKKYAKIIKGVKETLPYLYDNYEQVISTNWFKDSQVAKLSKYDLCKYFRKIYSCEGVYPKPNKEHFHIISSECELDPSRCLVIGDSLSDMKSHLYGFNTLLVDYRNSKQGIYPYSDVVVNDFKDVRKVLTRK